MNRGLSFKIQMQHVKHNFRKNFFTHCVDKDLKCHLVSSTLICYQSLKNTSFGALKVFYMNLFFIFSLIYTRVIFLQLCKIVRYRHVRLNAQRGFHPGDIFIIASTTVTWPPRLGLAIICQCCKFLYSYCIERTFFKNL